MTGAKGVSTVSSIGAIERIRRPSRDVFQRDYVATGTPVIIVDELGDWQAPNRWSLEYLRATVGQTRVQVSTSKDGVYDLESADGILLQRRSEMRFEDFIETVTARVGGAPRMYLQQAPLTETFPELAGDVSVPTVLAPASVTVTNLWLGAGGNVSPLHYDLSNNLLAQVRGRKRLRLYDPTQWECLYPREGAGFHLSRVNIDEPDLATFPDFRRARAIECTLEPGEILFLPVCWWHQVHSLETSISVNFWWPPRFSQCLVPGALRREALLSVLPDADSWATAFDPADSPHPIEVAKHLQVNGYSDWLVAFFAGLALELQLKSSPPSDRPGAVLGPDVTAWLRVGRRSRAGRFAKFQSGEVEAMTNGVARWLGGPRGVRELRTVG